MRLKQISPLRYPGGKAKILDFIIKIIEDNGFINSEYFEPYAGGAGVALGLLISGKVSQIHINDIDPAIYAFWRTILNNTERFVKKIRDTNINVAEWEKQKKIYKYLDIHSEFDRAFCAFFLNRCNRSGIITGGCIGGKKQEGKYKIDARFNKDDLIKRIEMIALYRNQISLYNQDTLELLRNNKHRFRNAVIYLDPPYYVKGQSLYRNYYNHDDHLQIAKIVKQMQGLWIVSYDNVPQINDFYNGFRKKEFNISYSAGTKKIGREVMFFSNKIKIPAIPVY